MCPLLVPISGRLSVSLTFELVGLSTLM